jgi:hypothetical protein
MIPMTEFNVQLNAGTEPSQCSASAWGQQIHTITDEEATAFSFNDWARIQHACGTIIGKNPDAWFLHNPTVPHPNPGDHRYDNSYDVFGWTPVTVTLRPIKAEALGVNSQPVIAHHVEWRNETDHTVHYSAGMSVEKSETVAHSSSERTSIGVGTKIGFQVGIAGFGDVSGEASFTFTKDFENTTTNSQTITVGVQAGAESDVPAHSVETAYLFSTLGSATFRVTYQASLTGLLMTLNDDWYGGHCYRGWDASYVLGRAGLPSTITIQHDHTVGFFSGATVDVAPGPYDPNHHPAVRLSDASRVIFAPLEQELVTT